MPPSQTESARRSLSPSLPFIWPENRIHEDLAEYAAKPPDRGFARDADLIACLLVGAGDGAVGWLMELMAMSGPRRVCAVVVLVPAGPTREHHLEALLALQDANAGGERILEVRLLPMDHYYADDARRITTPPSVAQFHASRTGRTVMCLGSVGDAGLDPVMPGSFNVAFEPSDALRNQWRIWFEYARTTAAPLRPETARVPYLVPPQGDPEAAAMWQAFTNSCSAWNASGAVATPTVDPETGEVVGDADGGEIQPWDGGTTALDPLAQMLQQVYAKGWLVTIDEGTRIKPLAVPVKATLLGQQSERTVGALKQRQSFTLQVLDDDVDRSIEKCRKVTDLMELLTFPLSQGNRWLPAGAKDLLERELESRNQQGLAALRKALGDKSVKEFVEARKQVISKDLSEMYRQLGQGNVVPPDRVDAVLADIERRLSAALSARITPRAVYNRISPPDLTASAPDTNWNQPRALMASAARVLREASSDPYFPRRFSGVSFTEDDFRQACDILGDVAGKGQDRGRAVAELALIDEIIESAGTARDGCERLLQLIRGESPANAETLPGLE